MAPPEQQQPMIVKDAGGSGMVKPALFSSWTRPPRSNPINQQAFNAAMVNAPRVAVEDDSWEARAFAEDAASCSGQWPPRSYTCSFCQREFRTAQALGGHMNVHRRERASGNAKNQAKAPPPTMAVAPAAASDAVVAAAAAAASPALGFCWVYPAGASPMFNHHHHHHHADLTLSLPFGSNNSSTSLSSSLSMGGNSSDSSSTGRLTDLSVLRHIVIEDTSLDLELRLGI